VEWIETPPANGESEAFFKGRAFHYFRNRGRYPLEPGCVNKGLSCFVRSACVDEARLFIRLCRIEQGRKDRPRWWNDRPYHRYSIWY
jgi:hypothetical protein